MRSWNAEEGDAAVLYDWEKNRLEVRFSSGDNALDLSAPVDEDSVQRSVGGHCQLREDEHVQVLPWAARGIVCGVCLWKWGWCVQAWPGSKAKGSMLAARGRGRGHAGAAPGRL